MKRIETRIKASFLKKIFIKICRIFGYEIIDQANFTSPTLDKNLEETLSEQGKKSITIPFGKIDIKRKVKSLKIILRTCTSELIMDQNKKRLFDQNKNEYTFRALKSVLKSVEVAKKSLNNIKFSIIVTDTNSPINDTTIIKDTLKKSNIEYEFLPINLKNFENKITPGYSKAKFANMANFYTSLMLAKENDDDLIYFVEDDYIHSKDTITEMIYSYEKFTTIFKSEIVLLPADYPYLYNKNEATKIYLGEKKHWRLVSESLVTFMTSKKLIVENFHIIEKMGKEWVDPWEEPLHKIYKKNPCLSPIPSLAYHCANINSVFGVSPNIELKKLWDENK